MPSLVDTPGLVSLLRQSGDQKPRSKPGCGGGGIFRMFKLLPALSSGCKMVALLGRPGKALLADHATTVTLFGPRKGRVCLAIQEDSRSPPVFLIELPMQTSSLHKEMASGLVKLALESETRTHRKKLMEEYVWAVYCNGRKSGYSIRRKQASDDERQVMQLLRGVSMGAGVLPCASEKEAATDGEMTYMRARFERVVGSKDSLALYMINPDGTGGPELSIFLGHLDSELNDIGRQQALAVASHLSKEEKFAAIYSSDLQRAAETARIIARSCNLPEVILDPSLRERHLGDLQGLTLRDAQKQKPISYKFFLSAKRCQELPGGGESLDQLHERCTSFLENLARKHKGERIVVVTHGGVLRELYRRACPMGSLDGKIKNASVNVIHIHENGQDWSIKKWGDVSHLQNVGFEEDAFGGDKTSG